MAREMETVFDATLTAELAVRHPTARQYAAAHGKRNGATDIQLQILAHGDACTNVVNNKVCGSQLFAPAPRIVKLRYKRHSSLPLSFQISLSHLSECVDVCICVQRSGLQSVATIALRQMQSVAQ